MRGDIYDAQGRFVGREGGFSSTDPLGSQIANYNRQMGQMAGDAQTPKPPPEPDAGTQLAAMRNPMAGFTMSPSAFMNQFRWTQNFGPRQQSLIATNPNVYQNQHAAANQMEAALQGAGGSQDPEQMRRALMNMGTVNVRDINGSNQGYTYNSVTNQIVPQTGSLDSISWANSAVPSVQVRV